MASDGKKKSRIGPLALIAIIAVVVIIALGAYAVLTLSRYFHSGSMQGFKVLGANQTGTLSHVIRNITGGFNSNQFEVSYSGNVAVSVDGLQLSLPLKLNVSRYYNDSRAAMRLSGVPLIGNFSIVQIRNGNNYYSCSKVTRNSSAGFKCMRESESNSIFTLFNLSSGPVSGVPVHFGIVNQSSHNGIPCTNINGYFNYSNSSELNSLNLSSRIGQRVSAANLSFLSCVSADKIPLTLYVYAVATNRSSTLSAALQLGENSFSNSSSQSIAELPGPVVNSTG